MCGRWQLAGKTIALLYFGLPFAKKKIMIDVHIPGEHVSNISPDSAGCINLSMRPRERMEGEKMTGRFV